MWKNPISHCQPATLLLLRADLCCFTLLLSSLSLLLRARYRQYLARWICQFRNLDTIIMADVEENNFSPATLLPCFSCVPTSAVSTASHALITASVALRPCHATLLAPLPLLLLPSCRVPFPQVSLCMLFILFILVLSLALGCRSVDSINDPNVNTAASL